MVDGTRCCLRSGREPVIAPLLFSLPGEGTHFTAQFRPLLQLMLVSPDTAIGHRCREVGGASAFGLRGPAGQGRRDWRRHANSDHDAGKARTYAPPSGQVSRR